MKDWHAPWTHCVVVLYELPQRISGPLVTPLPFAEKKGYDEEEEMSRSFSSVREKHVSPPKSSPAPHKRGRTGPVRTSQPFLAPCAGWSRPREYVRLNVWKFLHLEVHSETRSSWRSTPYLYTYLLLFI